MRVRFTADDVGRRVSVRRRREGEGPRYTDVVGVLDDWSDGILRIRRRDGTVADIHESNLVAGRVVPDSSRRSRG